MKKYGLFLIGLALVALAIFMLDRSVLKCAVLLLISFPFLSMGVLKIKYQQPLWLLLSLRHDAQRRSVIVLLFMNSVLMSMACVAYLVLIEAGLLKKSWRALACLFLAWVGCFCFAIGALPTSLAKLCHNK